MTKRKSEVLVLLLILTLSFHLLNNLVLSWCFDAKNLYEELGSDTYSNIWDLFSLITPLLLCLTSLKRSGLVIGRWRLHYKKILFVCLFPVALTLIIYPFTSKPFSNSHLGIWLISPLAQDLFGGYIYGLLDETFPREIKMGKMKIKQALPLTAIYASLWHLPNFQAMAPAFVIFQLFYVFLFASWVYQTRQWTGSIIPVWITHVCVNFISWWL